MSSFWKNAATIVACIFGLLGVFILAVGGLKYIDVAIYMVVMALWVTTLRDAR